MTRFVRLALASALVITVAHAARADEGIVVKRSAHSVPATLDKLESRRGFRSEVPIERFVEIVGQTGCAIVGQTPDLAPADRVLYALRDVTATVDSMPLIVGSIVGNVVGDVVGSTVGSAECNAIGIVPGFVDDEEVGDVMSPAQRVYY